MAITMNLYYTGRDGAARAFRGGDDGGRRRARYTRRGREPQVRLLPPHGRPRDGAAHRQLGEPGRARRAPRLAHDGAHCRPAREIRPAHEGRALTSPRIPPPPTGNSYADKLSPRAGSVPGGGCFAHLNCTGCTAREGFICAESRLHAAPIPWYNLGTNSRYLYSNMAGNSFLKGRESTMWNLKKIIPAFGLTALIALSGCGEAAEAPPTAGAEPEGLVLAADEAWARSAAEEYARGESGGKNRNHKLPDGDGAHLRARAGRGRRYVPRPARRPVHGGRDGGNVGA